MRSSSYVKMAAAVAAIATVLIGIPLTNAQAAVIGVGAGSYRNDRPAGTAGPSNSDGAAVTPKVTAAVAGRPSADVPCLQQRAGSGLPDDTEHHAGHANLRVHSHQ